jgi:hypothetical protein
MKALLFPKLPFRKRLALFLRETLRRRREDRIAEMPSDIFEKAFSAHWSSCRQTCECGREYWDGFNSGYSWEEGEFEALEERSKTDPRCIRLEYAVSMLAFEGGHYVMGCECTRRFRRYEKWLWRNRAQIAEYLKARVKEESRKASASMEAVEGL